MPDMETILATTSKYIARNFKNLIRKHCTETFVEIKINWNCKSATWSDYKHHNSTVEFLICVFINSTRTLSRVYTRRTNDKSMIFQLCFLDALLRHGNKVIDKGLNLFDECVARCVQLSPQEKSAPLLPAGTVKCTDQAPEQIHRGCLLK